MVNPNIQFPVLRHLVVKDFGLFPGKDGTGISHSFPSGVTVIPGINGLGKTTLLNLIYRLLVGPFDPYKDEEGIQLSRTRLTHIANFDYFAKRDAAAAGRSISTGEFQFGERRLSVTRKLDDLSIDQISIDGEQLALEGNSDPESQIWRLSGCGSQYDFHFLVRSLLFFMEQKSPVIWDAMAQAEIFRILFLDIERAQKLSQLAYEVQISDSRRRNMLYELNRYKKQLLKMQARATNAADVVAKVEYAEARMEAIDNQLAALGEVADELERIRDSGRQKLDGTKLDLEEATRELEFLHHQYFDSLFPGLTETAKNVFLNLISDNGCLVCGSRDPGLSRQFQDMAKDGSCPVCRSSKDRHEHLVVPTRVDSSTMISKSNRVTSLKSQISEMEPYVESKAQEYRDILRNQLTLQSERETLAADAKNLRSLLPPTVEDMERTENYIKFTANEIDDLSREIRTKMNDYEARLAELREEVEEVKGNLTASFKEYAGSFLAEKCDLSYALHKAKVGQATETIDLPSFVVQMTSAVSPSIGTPRIAFDDVSESQKEFIDLAFRMAVLRTYAQASKVPASAMIVIETPESSLDSIFVINAGRMLRKWCEQASAANSIIATSNLNKENMIQALLGLCQGDEPYPSRVDINKRVLNLIEVAAENAALRANRGHYESEFKKATGPELIGG